MPTAPPSVDGPEQQELRALIERVRGGDREAGAQLYTRFYTDVLALLLARTSGDRHLAADLAQETFTKALYRLDRFEWRGPGSFRGWLARIAVNTFRDHVRSAAERHHGGYELPERPDEDDSTAPDAVIERDLDTVRDDAERILGQLKPDHQLVLRWTLGEGRPVAEVAAELGRSEAAVHQLKRRALDAARREATRVATPTRPP
jgi:RNA polymerase sigma-70 factor (ECF subfamily)